MSDLPAGRGQIGPETSPGYTHPGRRLLLGELLEVDQPDRLQLDVG